MQAEQQVNIQIVTDAQAEYQMWKIDTVGRMLRQDNQQATLESKVSELVARLEKFEKSGFGPSPGAAGGKDRWQLTRPKDMDPPEFAGKEEEWLKWKEATEDYVDAVHAGMKQALNLAALTKTPVKDRLQLNLTEDEWGSRATSARC